MPEKIDFKNAASTASLIYFNNAALLLIQRKREPFKGMWALPGGFHNCDVETLEEAAIREFYEETNLRITDLELFCVNSSPTRDPRGHVIDHVYIVKHCTGIARPKDDASALRFYAKAELPEMAFDHKEVFDKFFAYLLRGMWYEG